MKLSNLPNFLIIGAAKSGSTTLSNLLKQHPEVYIPYRKEPFFFSNDQNYARGLGWYASSYFKNAGIFPARGEASQHYLFWGEKTSKRIAEYDTDKKLKLIAIFRDPVGRAYSQYWSEVNQGYEDRTFEEGLAGEEETLKNRLKDMRDFTGDFAYFKGGQYATLLKPYLERFPRQNFHFLLLDDLKNDFSNTMVKLADFLNIRNDFIFTPIKSNTAYQPKYQRLHDFMHHPSGVAYKKTRALLIKIPNGFFYRNRKKLMEWNMKPIVNPPMNPETEKLLRQRFLGEVEELEKILGRSLDHWKPKR